MPNSKQIEETELNGDDSSLEWATPFFISDILANYLNNSSNNFELLDYNIKPGVDKGQNYISKIYRTYVTYRHYNKIKNVSFIIKASLEIPLLEEMSADFNVFQRETLVYKSILKEVNSLYNNIDEKIKFGPEVYLITDKLIVMEDLSTLGYNTVHRDECLNLGHCKTILAKLAKYHAATAVINIEKPELFKHHKKGNLTEIETPYHTFYRNAIAAITRFTKTLPDLNEYVENLENFEKNVINREIAVFTRKENGFNCLNHGDMWLFNILFQGNENKECVFVDFQEGYFGSPGIDLNFLFYTSCPEDVLDKHLDELLKFYHENLSNNLEKFHFNKIPTLEDVYEEFNSKITHGITAAFCIAPILFIENKDNADAMNFIGDSDECIKIQDEVFSSKITEKILRHLLPKFVEMKVL